MRAREPDRTGFIDRDGVKVAWELFDRDLPAGAPTVFLLPTWAIVRRSLEAAGYTVLAAAGADEAIQASERWGDALDVLLTDIVMPGAHGPELAAAIRKQRPGIGVVFMSGYAEGVPGRGGELRASGEFLPKPFSVSALNRAVGRAAAAALSRRGLS
jgi:two-component system cell cycle sensor histidine kinase/response regulator CckA